MVFEIYNKADAMVAGIEVQLQGKLSISAALKLVGHLRHVAELQQELRGYVSSVLEFKRQSASTDNANNVNDQKNSDPMQSIYLIASRLPEILWLPDADSRACTEAQAAALPSAPATHASLATVPTPDEEHQALHSGTIDDMLQEQFLSCRKVWASKQFATLSRQSPDTFVRATRTSSHTLHNYA